MHSLQNYPSKNKKLKNLEQNSWQNQVRFSLGWVAVKYLESKKCTSTWFYASTIGITFAFTGFSPTFHTTSYWCCCHFGDINLSLAPLCAPCTLPHVQLVCQERSVILNHPLRCLPSGLNMAVICMLFPPVSCTHSLTQFILWSPQNFKTFYSESCWSVRALIALSSCRFWHTVFSYVLLQYYIFGSRWIHRLDASLYK